MKTSFTSEPRNSRQFRAAYSLIEVMVAVLVMGTVLYSLYAGFSYGFAVVQSTRENLRATQIIVKRMENIRLYRWQQIKSAKPVFIPENFTTYYDPAGQATGSGGPLYSGKVTFANPPVEIPAAYRGNMLLMTVTLNWTNTVGKTKKLVRSREMQTYIARYGMQSYVYNPQ
jgi:Tfp pilus assembly protein PilV